MDQIYSKHKDGGRIGQYVNAGRQVSVDAQSIVSDRCELVGESSVINSKLDGYVRTSGTTLIRNSTLSGLVQCLDKTEISGSHLIGDITITDGSEVKNCNLQSGASQIRILGESLVENVTAYGPVWIENATVKNCELLPGIRIYDSEWDRSPRIVRSPYQFSLIESNNPLNLIIGCWQKSIEDWRKIVEVYKRFDSLDKLALATDEFHKFLNGYAGLSKDELDWIAMEIERWQ